MSFQLDLELLREMERVNANLERIIALLSQDNVIRKGLQ